MVADYGFARKSRSDVAMTICGTDEFMAPEVVFGEVYDERADVFSFGVFLCELMCRRVPGRDGFLQREPRTKFKIDFDALRAAVPADCPPSLVELAVQCCAYEAEERLDSEVRRCSEEMLRFQPAAVVAAVPAAPLTPSLSCSPLPPSLQQVLEWLSSLLEELDAAADSDPTPMPPPPSDIRRRASEGSGAAAASTGVVGGAGAAESAGDR